MSKPEALKVFNDEEYKRAHRFLATRVAQMMGRKLEEEDWAYAYHKAKDIPQRGWSNLNIDVMHGLLGVEQKMLRATGGKSPMSLAGTTQMHPAATRSIRIEDPNADPQAVMQDVLNQYNELIIARKQKVLETSGLSATIADVDMRTGWLIWENELKEFLYFEERMISPDPALYKAEWNETPARGVRKASKSLWIYERDTGTKRFSVTTSAGIKIQPYFDIPSPDEPYLYRFQVQGQTTDDGNVQMWITKSTARELNRLLGSLDAETISSAILTLAEITEETETDPEWYADTALPITVTEEAYLALKEQLEGISDEHRVQLLVEVLRAKP